MTVGVEVGVGVEVEVGVEVGVGVKVGVDIFSSICPRTLNSEISPNFLFLSQITINTALRSHADWLQVYTE